MGQKGDEFERNDDDLVVVNPKPKKGLASKAIDWLEWAFVKMMHDPKQPLHYLAGNFAPVDETPPLTDLPVTGHLPVSGFSSFYVSSVSDGLDCCGCYLIGIQNNGNCFGVFAYGFVGIFYLFLF